MLSRTKLLVRSLLAQSSTYDPHLYWNKRADPNNPEGRRKDRLDFDISYIRHSVARSDTILELGPGVGRTFPAYRPHTTIHALDISKIYTSHLKEAATAHHLSLHLQFLEQPNASFPFSDNTFDVGVASQVFLHQTPDIFATHFSEMARVCKKFVVITGVHANSVDSPAPTAPHVFAHDYIGAASSFCLSLQNTLVRDGCLYCTITTEKPWALS